MRLFPAIDIYDGKVIRLTKGDFGKVSGYDVRPLDAAKSYYDAGCRDIHIVDLEGAKNGRPCNLAVLDAIRALGLFVQYGGGLRSADAIADALSAGASRVMVGSLLFKNDSAADEIFSRFGAAVMPAIDVKAGLVVHSGWLEGTDLTPARAIDGFYRKGFTSFLVTDTERDGMLDGIRDELYAPLVGDGFELTAAGGVTTADDIKKLRKVGVGGAVIGKSLFEGKITLRDAMKAANE